MTAVTAETLEIRSMAREFATGEIRPYSPGWDAERALPDGIFGKLGELGFMGMGIPEAYGGLDLDLVTTLLTLESLAWGDAAVALSVAIHGGPVVRAILDHGSEEQRERWLPEMATGETLGAFALSEQAAGSDATALELTARPTADGWTLAGRKRWVTNGNRAGLILVFARTGEGKDGISAFLVPRALDGIEEVGRERTLGLSASETVSLEFDETRLPTAALLGREGEGWTVARGSLTIGRLSIAAQALGIAQAAYEHAIGYSREREQFGRPLSEFGAIREKLAEMALRLEQSRALMLGAAGRWETGRERAGTGGTADGVDVLHLPSSLESAAAMAKVSASRTAMWVTDEAVQIFGGYGYMRDYPVEKLMRDAKGTEIYEGTNEVLQWLVARDLLGEVERK
jgi:alkylation response protein AidB-like acyl-CoA dehydrogenase